MSNRFVLATVLVIASVGCQPSGITRTYDKPIPALPPAGSVRIVPHKFTEDGKTVHWKWTMVGDRNWVGHHFSSSVAELTDSYPLDALDRIGGTNAYEIESIITATDVPEGRTDLHEAFSLKTIGVRLTGAINGSIGSGGGANGSSVRPGLKKVAANQAARALLIDEKILRLPVDEPLLEVKGEVDGKPFSQVFSVKISE